jgi:hypothetical protein
MLITWCLIINPMNVRADSENHQNAELSAGSVIPDSNWHEVLRIASAKEAQAEKKLKEMSKSELPSGKLAKLILKRWDKDRNTFYTKYPIPVITSDFTLQELKDTSPSKSIRGNYEYKTYVDNTGRVTKVVLINPTSNKKFNNLLERILANSLYCPAKPSDSYIASERQYVWFID